MSCARSSLLLLMRMCPLLLYDAPPDAWDNILTPPWDPGPRVLCCDIKQNRAWRRPKIQISQHTTCQTTRVGRKKANPRHPQPHSRAVCYDISFQGLNPGPKQTISQHSTYQMSWFLGAQP